MAAVTQFTDKSAAGKAAHKANNANPSPQGNAFMRYLDSVSQATDYMLTHPISDMANALSAFAGLVTGNGNATRDAVSRMMGWAISNPIASLKTWVIKQVAALAQQIQRNYDFLIKLIFKSNETTWAHFTKADKSERYHRILGDKRAEIYALRHVRALHSLIEREAAGAYRAGYQGRIGDISKVAEYLAEHNPIVKRLVADLISGALDLASVDDPIARLALSFAAKHIIERLGVDKIAGRALSDLLAPLLGDPRPHSLPAVITDISARLGALEGQQAQFWTDGGAEVEQAGEQWSAITSPLVDAALIGWMAQAVTDPQRWARELSGAVEPVLNGAHDLMTKLLREG